MNSIDAAKPAPPVRMPGGTVLTKLSVYDTPSVDGQRGGTPHVHLVCTELYFVLSGSGAVETIDRNGFLRVELTPHEAYVFTAGTIHRLINPNCDLELLIVMQNSGLPEHGDNIVTFPSEVLEDPSRYSHAMKADTLSDALRRRDKGVEGFLELKAAFATSQEFGRTALDDFYKLCLARTQSQHQDWYARVTHGAFEDAQESLQKVIALTRGHVDHLHRTNSELLSAAENTQVGFCGQLGRYVDGATLEMDGQRRF